MSTKEENTLSTKSSLVNDDEIRIIDSAASDASKAISYSNLKTALNADLDFASESGAFRLISIANGSSSATIAAAFDTAQTLGQAGYNVEIQFANGSYTFSQDYTFTNMQNVRILGNSADTGSGSGKSVDISIGDYTITFTNCRDVEWRYIELNINAITGSVLVATNSNLRILDTYNSNSNAGNIEIAQANTGSYVLLQTSTIDGFYAIANVSGGIFDYGSGNTYSNGGSDPYFSVSSGLVIDRFSTYATDDGISWTYPSIGNRLATGTGGAVQTDNIKSSSTGSNLSIQSDNTLSLNGTTVTSTAIYNDYVSDAVNMTINSSGRIRRSTSSIKYKTGVENIEKTYVDNLINNARPVYYKDKANPSKSYYGFIAEEIAQIEPRFVSYKWQEKTGEREVPILNKDGSPKIDSEGNPVVRIEPVYTDLATPEPEGVDYARMVAPLLFKVKEQENRIKILEDKMKAMGK